MAISYYYNLNRFGLMVLLLHDIGDIFLYSAKTILYKKYQATADVLFGVFAVTFFTSRIVLYPLICVIPSWQRLFPVIGSLVSFDEWIMASLPSLLAILYCLQVFWWTLIWRMIKRTLSQKSIEKDVRSDTDDPDTTVGKKGD